MSFLNPVSEPVKRFSSTDAGAPQINYNSRVAGDVKTVLKACLVTGYGDKSSAGWSIVNEVDHVCEFVSPSAAMSEYQLGIDDSLATKTTWYYKYGTSRTDPIGNAPVKSISGINKTHVDNGWRLFVTDSGIAFIEVFYYTDISKMSARITCFSRVKSALEETGTKNILFFNQGHDGQIANSLDFYASNRVHLSLNSYDKCTIIASNLEAFKIAKSFDKSSVDLVCAQYIIADADKVFAGQIPPIYAVTLAKSSDLYTASETTVGGRPAFRFTAGFSTSNTTQRNYYALAFIIFLDYWEY